MSSQSTNRQSLHRERKKRGLKCVMLEIRSTEISELVRRGLLADGDMGNLRAVRDALYAHLDKTLQGAA